jgi:hypothetical protein
MPCNNKRDHITGGAGGSAQGLRARAVVVVVVVVSGLTLTTCAERPAHECPGVAQWTDHPGESTWDVQHVC